MTGFWQNKLGGFYGIGIVPWWDSKAKYCLRVSGGMHRTPWKVGLHDVLLSTQNVVFFTFPLFEYNYGEKVLLLGPFGY
jgi:hypothetical protein